MGWEGDPPAPGAADVAVDPDACWPAGWKTAQAARTVIPATTTLPASRTRAGVRRLTPRATTAPMARGIPNTTATVTRDESSSPSTKSTPHDTYPTRRADLSQLRRITPKPWAREGPLGQGMTLALLVWYPPLPYS